MGKTALLLSCLALTVSLCTSIDNLDPSDWALTMKEEEVTDKHDRERRHKRGWERQGKEVGG